MLLHIVSKSPSKSDAIASCFRVAVDNSGILLIEDGVYAVISCYSDAKARGELNNVQVYALKSDLAARGIENKCSPDITKIDYSEFVELTEKFHSSHSWF
jgi:tRNA 2-thiouridine synthesizing protein B